ncbi:SNF2-related protein [Hydrogenimonas thermophila]|uniref:Superfamily II DNA or RNA helicase, SNF2 family n=1 Tax=Hydrogenimonas thermophila TaxID=223786 RepID=A0A1I5N0V4_9BACT|nr:SNF2-related protein [Hydrogenimonas thermophila]SFP15423.1 Superfamily II DNA or RNA helicase, SNF2 family [Hydrogenimonas thermophila]
MARPVYGKSVWGGYFLDALNRLYSYDARVGRGRSYASSGKVYDLSVNKNEIKAKVRGNWDPYYNVKLKFNPLSSKEIEKIYSIIDSNPLILASIINGELPSTLLELLKIEGIELFPKDFSELKRSCSCPDWGDPCKHMAGVYFVLTSMIDNNPFLLFEIRGVELINHYKIENELDIAYPFELEESQGQTVVNEEIDIIKFNYFKEFILSKLQPNPSFVSIDFHKVLGDFYKFANRFLATVVYPDQNEHIELIERVFKTADFKVVSSKNILDYRIEITHSLLTRESIEKFFGKESDTLELSILEFARLFLAFSSSEGNEKFNYFYHFFRVAYLLSNANGFVFDILKDNRSYIAIAKPLLSPLSIQKQLLELQKLTPEVLYVDKKALAPKSTNEILLSIFLSELTKALNFPMKKGKGDRIYETLFDLLFRGKRVTESFELRDSLKSLDRYFSIFDILHSNIKFTIVIENRDNDYTMQFLANGKNIHKIDDEKSRITVYKLIVKFADTLQEIESLTKQKEVILDFERLEKFILEQKEIIQDLGIGVVIPKELQKLLRPKLKIRATVKSQNLTTFLSLDKLLEYDFFLAIGDKEVSKEEFEELLKSGKKLVKFKEQFIYLDPKEVDYIFKQMQKHKKLSKFDLLHLNFNDDLELDETLKVFIDDIFKLKEYSLPPVRATLREYQKSGFLWAVNNLLNGFGVILADDMGLGKTLQAIAVMLFLKQEKLVKKPVLVVVPTTLLNNWSKEIEKFAPTLSYSIYYGKGREFKDSDIILTSYQILRRDLEKFKEQKFDMIVIDEAQNIKNPLTSTAQSVKAIKSRYRVALSGTPVENNLSELWSIFDFAIPRYLKSLKDFQKEYAKEIEINKNQEIAKRLKNITAPFMLRRLKTDKTIINDLPQKIVIDQYITMEKEQAALYGSFLEEMMDNIKKSDSKDRSGLIFKLLISLKQICNHPKNFDNSYDLDYKLSGKSKLLLELLETIIERDEKVLIFTQYTQMGDILEEIIKRELLLEPLYLKGSLSKSKRDELVESFNNDKDKKIFILSLKAGGVGLNLTSANNVIHYDLWFNPAVENQATDRAFRIGQTKNVNVFRFITQNSFEEKIDKMIKAKEELQNLSVSVGESWIGKMSDEELESLFGK